MRNPNRLDKFYDEMKEVHKKSFPDWRFGQLMSNFLGWLYSVKGRDPFFPEEGDMIEYFKEFANGASPLYRDN